MIFLDTHIVVWLYAGLLEKLTAKVIQYIENNDVYISEVVRLELQYLFEIGRIKVTSSEIIKELDKAIGLKVYAMDPSLVFSKAIEFEWTRDVFDRLITAEASVIGAGLISKDKKIITNYEYAIWK